MFRTYNKIYDSCAWRFTLPKSIFLYDYSDGGIYIILVSYECHVISLFWACLELFLRDYCWGYFTVFTKVVDISQNLTNISVTSLSLS
jgi:hypothetical protein